MDIPVILDDEYVDQATYGAGSVRSLAQYMAFTNITTTPYVRATACEQLHWVPFHVNPVEAALLRDPAHEKAHMMDEATFVFVSADPTMSARIPMHTVPTIHDTTGATHRTFRTSVDESRAVPSVVVASPGSPQTTTAILARISVQDRVHVTIQMDDDDDEVPARFLWLLNLPLLLLLVVITVTMTRISSVRRGRRQTTHHKYVSRVSR